MNTTYGQRLEKALQAAQKDRQQLADALGVSVQAISQVIVGKTKALTAENSARAARYLKADWHWLATGTELGEAASHLSSTEQAWPFSLDRGEYDQLSDLQRSVLDRVVTEYVRACLESKDSWGSPAPKGVVSLEKAGKNKRQSG